MTNCRNFNGYKPCGKSEICDALCPHLNVPTVRLLVVHLEALGAVLRSTALLPALRRKFPGAHITWITKKPANQLLSGNPLIDRVLTTEASDLLALGALEFDAAFVLDKSLEAGGVLKLTHADLLYGFKIEASSGAVVPATPAAHELWELGLSNHKKFFVNRKPETRLAHEALELGPWRRDEYSYRLTSAEQRLVESRRAAWKAERQIVVGINTGCSQVMANKKLSVETQRELVRQLSQDSRYGIVLLGGREDTIRNQRIAHGLDCRQSPTELGLRDGACSVAACDIVVTGDSLGMHMAIALGKWTVAWFGPTCAHEIDLYDRGEHVITQASCSPCWKRNCSRQPMCYDLVPVEVLVNGVNGGAAEVNQRERSNQRSERPLDHSPG